MSAQDGQQQIGYSSESVYDDYQYEEEEEEYKENEEEQVEDDIGSELSIPDEDINFDLVYALHTFTATVEGQASVVRGDALTLLDDSNSYWWLVKVLKTAEVGYIPAENIEITRKDHFDSFPTPPPSQPKKRKKVTLAEGVQYQSQFIYSSTSDSEEEDFEYEFHEWDEAMQYSESSDFESSDDDEEEESSLCFKESQLMQNNALLNIESHSSIDSDILPESNLEHQEETIKISLTPTIAKSVEEEKQSYKQSKSKKTAKLEKLLHSSLEKKEKKGRKSKKIRKFFSRGSKKEKKTGLESELLNETSSINSSQSSLVSRDRMGSVDSTQSITALKIQGGSDDIQETWVNVYPSTTAAEVIQQIRPEEDCDYYLVVKTLGGDECTLVPSDKPLEIFYSLTTHLNTPMPSLKKARRISQLMGSDHHIGGPTMGEVQDEVQFFLFTKPKRMEDGEFEIKVCHEVEGERVDKLVKISCGILIKHAVTLLLEKFHVLNGVVADEEGVDEEAKRSLRLSEDNPIEKYRLAIRIQGEERVLPLNDTLFNAFGEHVPPIHYRRSSHNPDQRESITTRIRPPEENETCFILKCVERKERKERRLKPHLVRHNTPMPRKESKHQTTQIPVPIQTNNNQDTLLNQKRPKSNESILVCTNDFGMNDLMVIIRGMANMNESNGIRTEIIDLFKEDVTRLDQLEKELDSILMETIEVF
ncbi:hypothetical protein G6F43_011094 [Rhizopus delemar]|nr:hypothetical protein G6F43_011094 [Rhizopus delemar]